MSLITSIRAGQTTVTLKGAATRPSACSISRTGADLSRFPLITRRADPALPTPVEAVAAPGPVLRVRDELALDRVEMHVVQFLVFLPLASDVEVVEAALPEARWLPDGGLLP